LSLTATIARFDARRHSDDGGNARIAADGQAALPYLREFVTLLPDLRVVEVMGSFAQRWWFRYLIDCPDSHWPLRPEAN
jgi:hypothetical protein